MFDPWQQGFGSIALGCRDTPAGPRYASTIGGVCASIPRQVGKTRTVGQLIIGLCLEFPGLRVVWTSHHGRTNTNTFKTLQGLVKRKGIRGQLAKTVNEGIRSTNGEQEIEFANKSIIMFGARAQGFGRGMEEVDILALDEAQILDLKALEDMVPSTNQSKHEFGALIFFLGTPPRPDDPGEAFTAKRSSALAGNATDHVWVEFSADPAASIDDESQWPVMNPSYPHRTPRESMLRMRENLPDDDAWRREAMGIWPEDVGEPTWVVMDRETWSACAEPVTPGPWLHGDIDLAVEVAFDRSQAWIVASGMTKRGVIGSEVIAAGPGTGWVVPHLVGLKSDTEHPVRKIILDQNSPATSLQAELEAVDLEVTTCTYADVKQATGAMFDAIASGEFAHRNAPELTDAVAFARKRTSGDVELIDRKKTNHHAGPFIGAVLSRWGLTQTEEPAFAAAVYA